MKTKLQILAFAAIAVAALSSCAKEQFRENTIPTGEKIQVSISGRIREFIPADATKANAQSVVRVTWAENDKVYVYDGTDASIGTLTVTPDGKNSTFALLSGTITASTAETTPTKLTLVYVKSATAAPAISGGKISVDLSAQDQSEVPFVLYSTIDYNTDKLTKTGEYVTFSFATSVMTVNCTGLATGKSITKAEIDGVSTICDLTVTGDGVTVAGATKGTITRSAGFQTADSRGSFKLALAADPETPAARTILVHQVGGKVSGASFTTNQLNANCSYNTVYQMGEYIEKAPDKTLSGKFSVSANKTVYFSKGNLWADGSKALHFEDNQYSFATSWDEAHVSHFTWSSTVEAAAAFFGYDGDYLFCDESHKVPVDGSEAIYYALTIDEWQYLLNNHVKVWGQCNSMDGYFIAPDGYIGDADDLASDVSDWGAAEASGILFLPASGCREGPDVYALYSDNFYLSSSSHYYGGDEYSPYTMWFGNNGYEVYLFFETTTREYAYNIRLVTESSDYSPAVPVTGVTLNKNAVSIEECASKALNATIAPEGASNKGINWASSNEAVATVNERGMVTGVAAGSAVITATTADGHFTAFCLVTVLALPEGALSSVFSVGPNATDKVHFSQGNLYWDGSEFNFEANQYDFRTYACKGSCIDGTYSSTDGTPADNWGLFGWSTAVSNYGMSTSQASVDYDGEFKDWGTAFDDKGTWRTLSQSEWEYLIDRRTVNVYTGEGFSYQRAKINYSYETGEGIYGLILYPDNYTAQTGARRYTSEQWTVMEKAGCIFLPAAGSRNVTDVGLGEYGGYWSSSEFGDWRFAYGIYFRTLNVFTADEILRDKGRSVRLITDVQAVE